ncbi:isochorismate synthase [Paraoerskovia sediminicola]|uniref:Isochorismate synthase n=1 Tax=Paraoerskovia sediminicola TaxID=1138587 RepID=A0ABM8FZZ1_9CELL|nr:chorismate-binding protein [Paraoerskovia sediminicola]BDZ41285.1 isochorismate synthase [Paraoerskovia sediminicola]
MNAAPAEPVAPRLVVTTTRIPDLPDGPGALVDLLPDTAPLVWVRRGDGIVGWGEALRLETWGPGRFADAEAAWQEVLGRAQVQDDVRVPGSGAVAFGSFAFEDSPLGSASLDEPGDDLPAAGVVIVPRVVVGRRGPDTWLTTLDLLPDLVPGGSENGPEDSTEESPRDAPAAVPPADPARLLDPARRLPVTAPGAVHTREGSLSTEDWKTAVETATARIRAGELDKVVLARDVVATTEHPVDPRHLLGRLARSYDACWTFSVDGLVGATPELLVRSEKGLVTSRVLAGTIRRSGSSEPAGPAADDDGHDPALFLARSSKDLEEHEYAVRSVADALAPFCSSMNVPEAPFVLHLPNVLHLASDVTGVLRSDPAPPVDTHQHAPAERRTPAAGAPSSLALAAALHPSAAVCGTPTRAARAVIHDVEGLDRGRYAAPVGWFGADGDGEWGIALRSCEISATDARTVRLFAGCGIVAASDPSAELAESEAKLEPMRGALGA